MADCVSNCKADSQLLPGQFFVLRLVFGADLAADFQLVGRSGSAQDAVRGPCLPIARFSASPRTSPEPQVFAFSYQENSHQGSPHYYLHRLSHKTTPPILENKPFQSAIMAVIDGIKGLTVTVLVDGEVAQEYPAPDAAVPDNLVFHDPIGLDSDPYVVHYIEAIPDRPFSVQVERLPSFQHVGHHIGYTFQIDDVVVRMSHDTSGRHSTWTGSSARFITKRPDGKLEYQSYRFAPIEICRSMTVRRELQTDLSPQAKPANSPRMISKGRFLMPRTWVSSASSSFTSRSLSLRSSMSGLK